MDNKNQKKHFQEDNEGPHLHHHRNVKKIKIDNRNNKTLWYVSITLYKKTEPINK